MSSESLTLQQLKDIKKLASDLGAESCDNVSGATASLSIPGSAVSGDIDGNAATASAAEQDSALEVAINAKADQSAMNTALAAKLDAPGTVPFLDIKQIGQTILGTNQHDRLGRAVSMNADGSIVAVGVYFGDTPNGIQDAGRVTVYERNETTGDWDKMGNDIYGPNVGDQAGWSVSLSDDGLTLAVGINGFDNTTTGYLGQAGMVRIYQYSDEDNGQWVRMGSDTDLVGNNYNEYFGHAVSLSDDGTVVAVGATNGEENSRMDYVKVYKWNPPVSGALTNGSWTQEGDMFSTLHAYNHKDSTGFSVSLNHNGTVIAIGVPTANSNGLNSGMARVYKRNTDTSTGWEQIGHFDGELSNDKSGTSVSLSDNRSKGGTMRLAIGAPYNTYGYYHEGHVRVFEYSDINNSWTQRGSDIDGGDESYMLSGTSVSLSLDGNTVVIGAPDARNAQNNSAGHVRIYTWDGAAWTQLGPDFEGVAGNDKFGHAVSLSADGSTVAIGAYSENIVDNEGTVRVYSLYSQALDIEVANAANARFLTGAITQTNPSVVNNMGGIVINGFLPNESNNAFSNIYAYWYARNGPQYYTNFNLTQANGGHLFGLVSNHKIMTKEIYVKGDGVLVFSDSRIKKNITDIPDNLALEQVRNLPCRYYEYKDVIERGVGKTIGFIAQEVKEVLPMAVKTMTDFIPDHMRKGEVSWEEVNGTHLMSVSNLDDDVVAGTKMKLYCVTGTAPEINEDGTIKTPGSSDFQEVEKDVVMNNDGKFIMDKQYDGIFIYGRQVNDKLIIDKSKIFALHHSAIQELDKTVEAQKATIAALEQQNAAQQAAIDALMARVAALEGQ